MTFNKRLDRETGLSAWCRIFYSFHLLTHDTRGARFTFPFNGRESLKDVSWSMLYVCGLSDFYGCFADTTVGIVTNLLGLHTCGVWLVDWQGAMSACISWAHLLFPLSLTLSLASLNYSVISPITCRRSCPALTFTVSFVKRPAMDTGRDTDTFELPQTRMFTEKIADWTT